MEICEMMTRKAEETPNTIPLQMKGHEAEDLTNRVQSQHTGKLNTNLFLFFEISVTKQTSSLLYETKN